MDAGTAAAISVLAALVSLCALIASVWLQWLAMRPRLKVTGQFSTLMSAAGLGKPRFGIKVANVGRVRVVVASVGVVYGNGERGTLTSARTLLDEYVLPRPLEPEEAVDLTNDLQPILDVYSQKGIAAVWASTTTGREFRGKNTANLGNHIARASRSDPEE